MRRTILCLVGIVASSNQASLLDSAWSQSAPAATATSAASAASNTVGANTTSTFRDPRTGRLYKQELQTVSQPVTRWQRKMVERSVSVPQTVIETQQVPVTVYVPQTEYQMQQKLKGWWNPLAQPTYAYESVPVTRWIPQTQMTTRQVPTVRYIERKELVPVDEPIQTTEQVQRLVVTEIPESSVQSIASANNPATAPLATAPLATAPVAAVPIASPANIATSNYSPYGVYNGAGYRSQPLLARIPLLTRQQVLPSTGSYAPTYAPPPAQAASSGPWIQPGSFVQSTGTYLRSVVQPAPVLPPSQSNYQAPMNVATRPGNFGRDYTQAGMPATVLR